MNAKPHIYNHTLDPQQLLKGFEDKLRESHKKPATISSYLKDARFFLTYLRDNNITLQHASPEIVGSYIEYLRGIKKDKPNTLRRAIIGIRQYFRFLTEVNIISGDALEKVIIPTHPVITETQITEKQLSKIFETLESSGDSPLKTKRDLALLRLIAYEGLKASELVNLRWFDLLTEGEGKLGFLHIGDPKPRSIALSATSLRYLALYKEELFSNRPDSPDSRLGDFMFIGFKGRNAALPLPRLTRHGLKFALYQFGQIINVSHLSAQMLRDHAIDHLLGQGMSQSEVMNHLGLLRLGNIARHL